LAIARQKSPGQWRPARFVIRERGFVKFGGKGILEALIDRIALAWQSSPMARGAGNGDDEAPLRAELLSADQMEQHGRILAGAHKLGVKRAPDQLLARLADNEAVLVRASTLLTRVLRENRRITPAGEWLLDNFYLIEEQIRTAKRHLPKGYSRELPRLVYGPSAGRPRVYDIALESVSHGDGRVDQEGLRRFVAAYQKITILTLGELWAIPIMLRLALIENLRRVATRISSAATDRELAGTWADRMIEVAEKDPKSLILMIADMARSNPPITSPFVAEFARRLQGQSAALALPLTWIEQHLSESDQTIEQQVQGEAQRQASDQVYVSNSIGSLRFLGAVDWREFVEAMSAVEQKLREDPDGCYGRMEFATRDRYRHIVEAIARRSPLSECDVARKAVQLAYEGVAQSGAPGTADSRTAHVGYYLIGNGLPLLESAAHARPTGLAALRLAAARHALTLYLGAILLLTAASTAFLMSTARADGAGEALLILVGLLTVLGASQLAVALVNWGATLLVMPHPLPRMDFSAGIPAEFRTLVVVPSMLSSAEGIDDLAEALEVRFLANQDDNLRFGLLTDWRDASAESVAGDAELLQVARTRIEELNRKYPGTAGDADRDNEIGDRFFLFHRPRLWNAGEQVWMGYERKRGKLADLNALLRGGAQDRFALVVGNMRSLSNVKYIITLDTDTQLPRDAARQFVGAMAHPLNRVYTPSMVEGSAVQAPSAGGLPVARDMIDRREGYVILQPRMASSLPSTNRSRYARLFGSESGIDPYTRAVSDVYQDLFAEGSFIGKGIYDIDAFEQALQGRFPENRILSHDLLEGCYARAGLLSDVQLVEEFPSGYVADMARRRRWVRGDWQIAGWLLTRVPRAKGVDPHNTPPSGRSNALSVLSQWKLFDNLRRSLVPPALTLLLLLGWTVLPSPVFWTLAVFALVLMPPVLHCALTLVRKPQDMPFERHISSCLGAAGWPFAQAAFTIACLPYEACVTLDAIARTHARVLFTHRRLLEWNPSQEPSAASASVAPAKLPRAAPGFDSMLTWRAMWSAPLVAVLGMVAIIVTRMSPGGGGATVDTMGGLAALLVAGPVLGVWFFSPAIAAWLSRPLRRRDARLSVEQGLFLRRQARKTWAFFETFMGPLDNWLPPDNVQEQGGMVVAPRTSPTNIGLGLLATLSAHDFGYLPAGAVLERSANTMRTLAKLERHHGHFFNWYDTRSLQPLPPRYISSVDSGNLAGHLLTFRQGVLGLADEPLFSLRVFEGLGDALGILVNAAGPSASVQMERLQRDLESAYDRRPVGIVAAWSWLDRLARLAADIEQKTEADMALGATGRAPDGVQSVAQSSGPADNPAQQDPAQPSEALWWARALHRQCRDAADELLWLAPWLALLGAPQELSGAPETEAIRSVTTLRQIAALQAKDPDAARDGSSWLVSFRQALQLASQRAQERLAVIERLAQQADEFAHMEYDFLYDSSRHLLAIGYNADDRRRDTSYYDLLASEARLACFVGIAQGQLPQESWFALGRLLTAVGGEAILMSWSGSMFEYLMPMLVMPDYDNTLLDQTCRAAVRGACRSPATTPSTPASTTSTARSACRAWA
jgi:cyclic beta-1,2-glucan synthetase